MIHRHIFLVFLLFSSASYGLESLKPLGSEPKSKYGYIETLPEGYESTNNWPIVIYLHGIGDQNVPLTKVGENGPNKIARSGKNLPMVILSPQSSVWWEAADVDRFISFALAKYHVDTKRIYLTGLSMGGAGVCDYVNSYGQKLAAAVAICPAAPISGNGAFKLVSNKIPLWLAHAEDDKRVAIGPNSDTGYSNILRTLGASSKLTHPEMHGNNDAFTAHFDPATRKVVWEKGQNPVESVPPFFYTVYHKGGHAIWDRIYKDDHFYEWLLNQHKN